MLDIARQSRTVFGYHFVVFSSMVVKIGRIQRGVLHTRMPSILFWCYSFIISWKDIDTTTPTGRALGSEMSVMQES